MNSGTILVTGSNGGIGSGVIEFLLKSGARNLACHYRHEKDKISACLAKYDLDPERHLFQAALTNEAEVKNMRLQIEAKLTPVWGLLNIAGSSSNALSWKMELSDFQQIINDNLISTFLCCREFMPAMRANASGRIINISSVIAHTGAAGASHYCAAKAAICGWTKSIALELAPKNITVNALALGYFNAGIISHVSPELQAEVKARIPLKRFGETNEIGAYINFLLSAEGQYTTGQVININGGLY